MQCGCTFKEHSGPKEVNTFSMNRYVLGAAGHLNNRQQSHTLGQATELQENRSCVQMLKTPKCQCHSNLGCVEHF